MPDNYQVINLDRLIELTKYCQIELKNQYMIWMEKKKLDDMKLLKKEAMLIEDIEKHQLRK